MKKKKLRKTVEAMPSIPKDIPRVVEEMEKDTKDIIPLNQRTRTTQIVVEEKRKS